MAILEINLAVREIINLVNFLIKCRCLATKSSDFAITHSVSRFNYEAIQNMTWANRKNKTIMRNSIEYEWGHAQFKQTFADTSARITYWAICQKKETRNVNNDILLSTDDNAHEFGEMEEERLTN